MQGRSGGAPDHAVGIHQDHQSGILATQPLQFSRPVVSHGVNISALDTSNATLIALDWSTPLPPARLWRLIKPTAAASDWDNGFTCTRPDMRRLIATVAGAAVSIAFALGPITAAALSEPVKYQFDRGRPWGGEGGATGVWSGVVVEVDGNKVTPKFAIQRRIFVNWWVDLPAQKIQACPLGQDGFSATIDCLTVDASSLTIPTGISPFSYSYKFLYVSEKGGTSEESFRLNRPD